MTGPSLHVRPSDDRLTTTASPFTLGGPPIPSDAISHCPCLASYATLGSLARSNGPPSADVSRGSTPWCVQVAPPSVDVAQPLSTEPASVIRPTWNVATIVEPQAKLSGSTSVACVPGSVGLYVSVLSRTVAAEAGDASAVSASVPRKRESAERSLPRRRT